MLQANPSWKPTYLKNQIFTIFVSFIYVGMNIIILVMTAIPTGSGIPGYYWTVSIIGFIAFGVFYWGVIRLLGVTPRPSGRRTLGSRLGLEIRIWEDGDDVPDQMKPYMDLARADGSKRRLDYKVSPTISLAVSRFQTNLAFHRLLDP